MDAGKDSMLIGRENKGDCVNMGELVGEVCGIGRKNDVLKIIADFFFFFTNFGRGTGKVVEGRLSEGS